MTTERTSADEVIPETWVRAFAAVAQVLGTILAGGPAAASGTLEVLRQASMAEVRPTLLSPAEVLEAYRRSVLTDAELENALARSGFSARAQEVMLELVPALLNSGELLELARRGELTPARFREGMSSLGYGVLDAELLRGLTEYVPQAQDVVTFAVREVYTPDVAERFGQYDDFPEQALEDFRRSGVTEELARKYWAAHWQLPSVQMVLEMYHRRAETGVTLDDVNLLLRSADVMPFWRDKIIGISTNVYTRVDIRRMHKLGILSDADVTQAYVDSGYSDERAAALAEFTIRLNSDEADAAIEPFRATIRGRAVSMYQNNTLGETELREALETIGYSAANIDAYVETAAFIRTADLADSIRSSIKKLYVQGWWTREATVIRLLDLGMDRDETAELIGLWDLDRELRETSAEERAQRDLTKTEILNAYAENLLNDNEAEDLLRGLGYDETEVALQVALADIKRSKAVRGELESNLRTLYAAGRVTEGDARGQMGGAGIPSQRIDVLVTRWRAEVRSKTPTLTVAQVQRAYVKRLIMREEAAQRLEAMGYSVEDREILIELAGEVPPGGGSTT